MLQKSNFCFYVNNVLYTLLISTVVDGFRFFQMLIGFIYPFNFYCCRFEII